MCIGCSSLFPALFHHLDSGFSFSGFSLAGKWNKPTCLAFPPRLPRAFSSFCMWPELYSAFFFISAILEILMPRAVFDASHFYFHSDSALHGNKFSECVVIPKEKETVKIRQSFLNGESIVYFSYTYSSCVCIFHILISQIFLCVCTRWPHESESENENGFRHRQDREAFESI